MTPSKRLAFSLPIALAFFIAGEVVLRVGRWIDVRLQPDLSHTEFTYDAHVGWQNYRALRGLTGIPPRRPGVVRVLTIGDSTCYGVEVKADETWSARLAEALTVAVPGHPTEVLNGGVAGFTSSQALAYLETRLAPTSPDLVITYVGHNDPKRTATGLSDRELADKLSNPISGLARASLFFWNVPHGMIATPLGEWVYGPEPKLTGRARVSPEEFTANLAAIRALATERHFAVRFVAPVRRGDQTAAAVADDYANLVLREPEAIDVLSGLLSTGLSAHEFFVDGTHPSAKGHAQLASLISAALMQDGRLAQLWSGPPS